MTLFHFKFKIKFNFAGKLEGGKIGSVFVNDADDWDLPDKTFSWKNQKPDYFDVDPNTGDITILAGTPPGPYQFEVVVRDSKWNKDATGSKFRFLWMKNALRKRLI